MEAVLVVGTEFWVLLYAFVVLAIFSAALRERLEDFQLLVKLLLETFAQKLGKNVTQMLEGTMRRLVEYSWPGNVRELQNVIERGVILSPGNLLVLDGEFSLAGDEVRAATAVEVLGPLISSASCVAGASLRDAERRHIEAALAATNWIIEGEKGAAKVLDIPPNTLRSRMKKLDLQRPGEPAYEGKRPS